MHTGAITGIVGGGIAAVTASGYFVYNWRRYILGLKDRQLAVLGQSKSGKTTFFNALMAIANENDTWKASDKDYEALHE